MSILEVKGVKKVYTTRFGNNKVEALKNVNFQVEKGEYVAIMGESGSGKTTLLNILAALDRPTGGSVFLDGRNLSDIRESDMAAFRRDELGFVFQDFNLLDTFPVEDNIYLPLVLAGKSYNEMKVRLAPIAEKLGITSLLKKYPYEISGGQKQRLAVATAVASEREIVLFDEPTSGLDHHHMLQVGEILKRLAENGKTVLVVTHDTELIETLNSDVIDLEKYNHR